MIKQSNRTVFAVIIAMIVMVASYPAYGFSANHSLKTSAVTVSAYGDYSFKVHNNTDRTITKVLVSENGQDFGYFNIGDGIAAGSTVELVWDKSTNGESCHQYFKAEFEGGAQSSPVQFDFCESGLVLEFN